MPAIKMIEVFTEDLIPDGENYMFKLEREANDAYLCIPRQDVAYNETNNMTNIYPTESFYTVYDGPSVTNAESLNVLFSLDLTTVIADNYKVSFDVLGKDISNFDNEKPYGTLVKLPSKNKTEGLGARYALFIVDMFVDLPKEDNSDVPSLSKVFEAIRKDRNKTYKVDFDMRDIGRKSVRCLEPTGEITSLDIKKDVAPMFEPKEPHLFKVHPALLSDYSAEYPSIFYDNSKVMVDLIGKANSSMNGLPETAHLMVDKSQIEGIEEYLDENGKVDSGKAWGADPLTLKFEDYDDAFELYDNQGVYLGCLIDSFEDLEKVIQSSNTEIAHMEEVEAKMMEMQEYEAKVNSFVKIDPTYIVGIVQNIDHPYYGYVEVQLETKGIKGHDFGDADYTTTFISKDKFPSGLYDIIDENGNQKDDADKLPPIYVSLGTDHYPIDAMPGAGRLASSFTVSAEQLKNYIDESHQMSFDIPAKNVMRVDKELKAVVVRIEDKNEGTCFVNLPMDDFTNLPNKNEGLLGIAIGAMIFMKEPLHFERDARDLDANGNKKGFETIVSVPNDVNKIADGTHPEAWDIKKQIQPYCENDSMLQKVVDSFNFGSRQSISSVEPAEPKYGPQKEDTSFTKGVVLSKIPDENIKRYKDSVFATLLMPDKDSKTGKGEIDITVGQIRESKNYRGESRLGVKDIILAPSADKEIKYSYWKEDGRYSKLVKAGDILEKWNKREVSFPKGAKDNLETEAEDQYE